MAEGYYDEAEQNDPYPWLHEFLCEYVDGTMDPAQRAAFEEYVRANPDLAQHVECLCRTRQLLCRHACTQHAAGDVRERLHRRLACEAMRTQPPVFAAVTSRLGSAAAFTSVMAMVLIVGMLGGAFLIPGNDVGFTGAAEQPMLPTHRANRVALPLSIMQHATAQVNLPASPYYHPHLFHVREHARRQAEASGHDTLAYGDVLKLQAAP